MECICVQRVQQPVYLLRLLLASFLLLLHLARCAEAGVAGSLQEELDFRCNGLFAEICRGGNKQFCDQKLSAVARKGLGIQGQNDMSFRCYDRTAVSGDTVDNSTLGVLCVDNCGNEVRCRGTVKRTVGSFHTSRAEKISRWIEEAKATYCSALQAAFDKLCSSRSSGALGRWLGEDFEAPLACVPREHLVFDEMGYCFNGCGLPSPCPGRPADGGATYVTLNATEKAQLLHGFQSPCKPYETCTHRPGEATQCTEANETDLAMQDDLQHWLDAKCAEAIKGMCVTDPSVGMCGPDAKVVMRKGFGHSQQKTPAYRCYDFNKIEHTGLVNTSEYGVKCVDNCGKEVVCGGTVNTSSVFHVTHGSIPRWIEEGKLLYCSSYQRALQEVCDSTFAGSLARRGVSTEPSEPVGDRWSCVQSPPMVYEAPGTCLNNCGGPARCGGGRQSTGSVNSSVQKMLTNEQVDAALSQVTRPCGVSEICSATTKNPPTCTQAATEIQPAPGETEGMLLGDGEVLSAEFNSPQVAVTIGQCFRVEINMHTQQVAVGLENQRTLITTAATEAPYRLSIQRAGAQVTFTLWYNGSSSTSSSLFYVQPGTVCAATDPVIFHGLEPEVQVSRGGVRSISRTTL